MSPGHNDEQKFRALIEAAPDALVIVNEKGEITLVNSQTEILFGYSRQELLGKTMEMLVPERFRSAHELHRGGYSRGPKARPLHSGLELYALRKDGVEIPVEISLSPLQTSGVTLVASAIRDVSERKRFERQLEEKNAALTAACEDLEGFAYSVSHDLRAPLRAISGFTSIAEKQLGANASPDVAHALQRVRENASKMNDLIEGLLAFAQLGQQPLRRKDASPESIVGAVIADMKHELHGRDVQFSVGALPQCNADLLLLKQVFVNLLSNAVKYTKDRHPALIEIGSSQDNGHPVYFVRDNGVGFDMQYAKRLFQVFQRLHPAHQFEGTGVGLALTQRIIERHGGKIWAEAAPDRGATFYFTIG